MCVCFVQLNLQAQQQTTQARDSVIKDSINLRYKFSSDKKGGLFLNDLAKKEIIFDKVLNKYVIIEKIGNYYTKTPIYLTQKEYQEYRLKRDMTQYFKDKVSATNPKKKGAKEQQKNLLPSYYIDSKFFKTVFGGNEIKFTPAGNLNLKLGFIYQNTENPQISEENRSNFTFDFDQQINASIQAEVGTRLKFTANYDTQATFDFQNLVKVEFIPPPLPNLPTLGDVNYSEDGIIQGIEAGNISMPIKNSLINGAQSLLV
jgi:protein involved in gliding motility SprA